MRYLFLILSFTLTSTFAFSQEDEVYTVVQEMPRCPGCEDMEGTAAEKKKCAEKKMLEYLFKNTQYIGISKDNIHLFDKMHVFSFVVEKDGCLNDVKVVRGTTKAMDDMYMKLISDMPRWVPGKHHGEPVAVRFNIPIRIKLSFD